MWMDWGRIYYIILLPFYLVKKVMTSSLKSLGYHY